MNQPDEFDPLDELTAPTRSTAGDAALRAATFGQGAAILRRRRMTRRALWGGALAACYATGVASHGLWRGAAPAAGPSIAASAPAGVTSPGPSTPNELPPTELATTAKSPYLTLREAGDEAWRVRNDMEMAIRLYAQALRAATPVELAAANSDDNWLFISLKENRP